MCSKDCASLDFHEGFSHLEHLNLGIHFSFAGNADFDELELKMFRPISTLQNLGSLLSLDLA